MNKSSISEQLQYDYPDIQIYLDPNSRMIVAGNFKMSLLNSSSALESMNIFSRSGKSFYQAIAQLLYFNYEILPGEGSYASTLIILKEDLKKYKIQKLAKEWGIGFLENDDDVLALEVDDGVERDLLLEGAELDEDSESEELEEWAKLEEINFDSEIAYMEKGLEFASAMEEVTFKDKAVLGELESSGIPVAKSYSSDKKRQIKYLIKNLFRKNF